MKRGFLLVLIILLVIPIVLGSVPASPESYPCEEGSDELCLTIGDQFYSEEYTVEAVGDLGKFKLKCPIARTLDAEGIRRPFFGYIADDGFIYPDTAFPTRDFNTQEIEGRDDFVCGQENIQQIRPKRPLPLIREREDMFSNTRLAKNAEIGIGIEYSDSGVPKIVNPTLKEAIDNYEILPPRLPEPQPEIIFLPTGYVSAEVQELRMVVVLVQFPDEVAKFSAQDVDDMFFGAGGFAEFYEEQSNGILQITGDVVGWYTASQEMGYYGDNYEYRVEALIKEAADLADDDVDYSQYDADSDGIVDGFFVVHAGEPDENGGGNGPEIWSHYFSISGKSLDGVSIIDYETVSEESPLGIVAHEFGHYLGLPDFYDTYYDDGTTKGVGDWSLMAYGAYVDDPVLDPWSKQYLGWLNADSSSEISEDGYYEIVQDNAVFGMKYYLLPLVEDEYFMLENRHVQDLMKKNDVGGILIWHVDESVMDETGSWNGCTGSRWTCNTVNSNGEHLMLSLKQADGDNDLEDDNLGDNGDPWYGSCGFGSCAPAQFNSVSNPSSVGYSTSSNDIAVSVNSEVGSTMEVGVSLSGVLFGPEEEVSSSVAIDSSSDDGTGGVSETISSSSNGMPSWVYVVVGVLIALILGIVTFVGVGLLRKE